MGSQAGVTSFATDKEYVNRLTVGVVQGDQGYSHSHPAT